LYALFGRIFIHLRFISIAVKIDPIVLRFYHKKESQAQGKIEYTPQFNSL
jgi:hypothetical protein